MKILDAALDYLKMGFSVIPVGHDKKPLIKWQGYQKKKAVPEEIKAWFEKWPDANIGIVTGIISNLAVIDLDEPEKARPILEEIIPDSLIFPIASTPSGGEHWYFQCKDQKIRNNARIVPGADLRAEGGYVVASPSVNGNGKGYKWLTDIASVDLPALPSAYCSYINNKSINTLGEYKGGVPPAMLSFSKGTRDNDLFHVANCLARGGMPDNEILQTLAPLASACNPPFPLDELHAKVISAIKRKEQREMNISEEVRRYISLTNGEFSVKDCYEQLNALNIVKGVKSSENLRVTIRQVLHNLKDPAKTKPPMIEPAGKRDGYYRRIDDVAELIDWSRADCTPLALKLPMGLNEIAEVYPGNIIVFAGESNSGKTAMTLNIAKDNANKFAIDYFSSEMGPSELRKRLSKFQDVPLDVWHKIKFMERTSNFADVLNGDRLTIIDFLEVVVDFYQIAALLFDIHKKMGKGVCIVNIQKNKGSDFGRGGQLGLEKPRLYLAIEQGKIKVIKCKAWSQENINPNGLQKEFKLVQGAKFIAETPWHKEGEI